ncbi:polyprenol monophosphomannose synthase [Myxococcota bacterium]|nr:polyprenol monophosphomannose synthase [Myxococcota bacterium]
MRLIVVVPTYNERQNLPELVARTLAAAPTARLVIVDDSSPDGTADAARRLAAEGAPITVLSRPKKGGLAGAYRAGFDWATNQDCELIAQLDADLSHDPADLPRLAAAGADLALGSRYVAGGGVVGWAPHRRALSRFGAAYARGCLGLPQRDLTGGFKVWRRAALQAALRAPPRADGYAFQVEMTWRAVRLGLSVVELPIVFTERRAGASKMSPRIAAEAAWLVPSLRWLG